MLFGWVNIRIEFDYILCKRPSSELLTFVNFAVRMSMFMHTLHADKGRSFETSRIVLSFKQSLHTAIDQKLLEDTATSLPDLAVLEYIFYTRLATIISSMGDITEIVLLLLNHGLSVQVILQTRNLSWLR